MATAKDDIPRGRIEQILDSEYAIEVLRKIAERLKRETGLFLDWVEIKIKPDEET